MIARGKFAEGQNFTGPLCRAIIVVGIPNANISDPKIQMKKKIYNKDKYNKYYNR